MTRPTRIRIGELVFRDLSPSDGRLAADAFASELQRLVDGNAAWPDVSPRAAIRLESPPVSGPRQLGKAAATALFRQLTGGAS